jgi:hypothetical protein
VASSGPTARATPSYIEVDIAKQALFLVDTEGRSEHPPPLFRKRQDLPGKRLPRNHAIIPCSHIEVFSRAAGWKKNHRERCTTPAISSSALPHGSEEIEPTPPAPSVSVFPCSLLGLLPKMVEKGMPVFVYGCKEEVPRPVPMAVAAGTK